MLAYSEYVLQSHRAPRVRDEEPIAAVCRVGGALRRSIGTTRDISLAGVYFYADFCPQIGSTVQLLLTLPRELTYSESLPVVCKGKVARVERNAAAEHFGIAVEIESYQPVVET